MIKRLRKLKAFGRKVTDYCTRLLFKLYLCTDTVVYIGEDFTLGALKTYRYIGKSVISGSVPHILL